jgi:hypothetical protein
MAIPVIRAGRRSTLGDFVEFSKALHFDVRSAIRKIADVKLTPKSKEPAD